MCGRYYIDLTTEESVRAYVEMQNRRYGRTRGVVDRESAAESMAAAKTVGRGSAAESSDDTHMAIGRADLSGNNENHAIMRGADKPQKAASGQVQDVRPSDEALLITGDPDGLLTGRMRWGFPASKPGQLLINARAETALSKPTFSDSVLKRRCIIPAAGFYEWDAQKNKVTFTLPENPCLFMAGFFRPYGDELRFIILTTDANASMRPVHDRMPLILPENEAADWIMEPKKTAGYLRMTSPMLARSQEYEQMRLPF